MKNTLNIQFLEHQICLNAGTSTGISATEAGIVKDTLYRLARQQGRSCIYIEQQDMLDEKMTVLEYLMFATRRMKQSNVAERQKEILEMLVSLGLGYISLTPIRLLAPQEKMVLLLWIALVSKQNIVIMDFTEYQFNKELIQCIKEMINQFKGPDTTLILGTMQPKLIGICLEETLFIHENQVLYYGLVSALQHCMDRVLYVIEHSNGEEMCAKLEKAFPMYVIQRGNEHIYVMRKKTTKRDDAMFFTTLAKEKIVPDQIKVNHGTIENSFQELIEFNAIFR